MRGLGRRLRWDIGRRRPAVVLGALVLAAAAGAAAWGASRLSPMIAELAVATATDDITIAVNETVAQVMSQGGAEYSRLVTLEKDGAGNVTALVTNVANVNVLQAQVTNAVVRRFADSDVTRVEIPLGTVLGGAWFSGWGPRIRVDALSVTNVTTSFRNEFTSAGINQTRHRIIMDVDVGLEVLVGRDRGVDAVRTEVSVAETVIVGGVPGTYAELGAAEN